MSQTVKPDIRHGFQGFETGETAVGEATIAWRRHGTGPATMLIHGWPMTGYEWHNIARTLSEGRDVIVPDYRGAGASSMPIRGYDNATTARDLIAVLDDLEVETCDLVGHDLGLQIAVAMALIAPDRVRSIAVMESMIPGKEAYQAFVETGLAWHFGFNASADLATDLVDGRELLFFEHFYQHFTGRPERIPQADREYYAAAYAGRDRLRAGFAMYEAFGESADFFADKMPSSGVAMPALVCAGEKSTAAFLEAGARDIGADQTHVFAGVGHFIPEEAPEELVEVLRDFWRTTNTESKL